MKVVIVNEAAFKYYNSFTKDTINSSGTATAYPEKLNYIVTVNGQQAAKICIKKTLLAEEFDKKLICYFMAPDGHKRIVFEVIGEHAEATQLKNFLHRVNKNNNYKSPLAYDVSIKVRDSVYSNPDKPADFRGFINLFIMFSLLNYSRLITEHTIKYKQAFATNVS